MENINSNQKNGTKMGFSVQKLATLGLLAAISIVLVMLVHFPLFPTVAPFLEYDPADIPILIGTIAYGPLAGLMLTVVVSFIQATTVSAHSGLVGFLMHVIATGAMAIVVGNLSKYLGKSGRSTAVSLAFGALTMVVAMVGVNLLITPIFMGVDISVVKGMIVPIIIPFNSIKAVINCIFTFIVTGALEKTGVLDRGF